jgi:ubiquinol-cytochrome c reductase cytochrome b subunit
MLPIALLGLMVVHFPRFLVFDVPMVMAISGAVTITGGVFPVGLGLPFEPEIPPGITVPEWYLTGLYAFLRTMYDKFITGVAWPGLFIFALLIVPFVDRYKKFSWKDRPIITAVGITSLAQIIVTTYWGFYIDPDRDKALLERLVIDPIFFYLVMILLVPLSFGFTYMMIKLARHAEANAKLQPKKAAKSSINLSQRWLYVLFIVLLAFQVYLNISAYYAMLQGMKNYSLFVIGIMMLVFAGMFHLYRYGRSLAKAPPPKPTPPSTARPMPAPRPAPAVPASERPLAAPPTAAVSKVGSEKTPQLSQQQKQAAAGGKSAGISGNDARQVTPSTEKDSSKGLEV